MPITKSTVTNWFFAGICLLIVCFVLAYLMIFVFAQAQGGYLLSRGGPGAIDFAAPYLFVINRGCILGILVGLCLLGYWFVRLHLWGKRLPPLTAQRRFVQLTLLFAPFGSALLGTVLLAVYLQQTEGLFTHFARLPVP